MSVMGLAAFEHLNWNKNKEFLFPVLETQYEFELFENKP